MVQFFASQCSTAITQTSYISTVKFLEDSITLQQSKQHKKFLDHSKE